MARPGSRRAQLVLAWDASFDDVIAESRTKPLDLVGRALTSDVRIALAHCSRLHAELRVDQNARVSLVNHAKASDARARETVQQLEQDEAHDAEDLAEQLEEQLERIDARLARADGAAAAQAQRGGTPSEGARPSLGGKHYQVVDAINSPAPVSKVPLMIGGGGEKKIFDDKVHTPLSWMAGSPLVLALHGFLSNVTRV